LKASDVSAFQEFQDSDYFKINFLFILFIGKGNMLRYWEV